MLVQVRQEHIDKGNRGDARLCPVALAIKDCGLKQVICGLATVETKGCSFRLPSGIGAIIHNFDMGMGMKPFEFELKNAY
jgi:hypothetical protein